MSDEQPSTTKTCAKCLSEIPAAATRCAHCGANPRPGYDWSDLWDGVWRLVIVGLVIVVGIAIGGFVGPVVVAFAGLYGAYTVLKIIAEIVEGTGT